MSEIVCSYSSFNSDIDDNLEEENNMSVIKGGNR